MKVGHAGVARCDRLLVTERRAGRQHVGERVGRAHGLSLLCSPLLLVFHAYLRLRSRAPDALRRLDKCRLTAAGCNSCMHPAALLCAYDDSHRGKSRTV